MGSNHGRDEATRRTVLGRLGTAIGATGLVSTARGATPASAGEIDGDTRAFGQGGPGRLEVDEKDMPIHQARCWPVNGTNRAVDFYVNYAPLPQITEVEPLSIGSVFTVDGTVDLPFGTYTFEVREAGRPDDSVLASASIRATEGDSFSVAFHRVGDAEYQLSIYRNDYSPSEDVRLVVRHNARPETIDWRISQNSETPRVPDDPRSGTLDRGQWQTATDVTESDYLLEVLLDGEVVALERDIEFEVETTYVCHVVGDPEPLNIPSENNYESTSDSGVDEGKWVLVQAYEVAPGSGESDVVTAPTEPVSTADRNEGIEFACDPVELFETNVAETRVSATDPDGFVTGLALDGVDPTTDAVTLVDDSVDPTDVYGGPTTATLRVGSDASPDTYDVSIAANPESHGTRATCTLPVTVKAITVKRLQDLVDQYDASGEIETRFATDLHDHLDAAETHLVADETASACTELEQARDLLGANKDKGVSETALNGLEPEITALRKRLGCG